MDALCLAVSHFSLAICPEPVSTLLCSCCSPTQPARDLLAFAFDGAAGGQDLLRQIRRRVGQRHALGRLDWRGRWRGGRASVARPCKHLPLLIDGELLDANQLNFQILQVVIIELKLALEGPIGDPLTLA